MGFVWTRLYDLGEPRPVCVSVWSKTIPGSPTSFFKTRSNLKVTCEHNSEFTFEQTRLKIDPFVAFKEQRA